MNNASESNGRRALAALADLARDHTRPPSPAEVDRGLDALRARMDGARAVQASRSSIFRWSLVGAVAFSAAIVAIVAVVPSGGTRAPAPQPALAYQIEGGDLVDGGYLRESGRAGIKLLFAEGTKFILSPGTRSRLRAVDGAGARIAIEHGTASFQVTPSNERRWQVDVGPFLVTVKGTVFTVSWDAAHEKFELALRHGSVSVSGPVTGGEIALRAGQRLVVDLPRGETVISEPRADDGVVPSPTDRPPPPAAARTVVPAARSEGDHRWAAALAAGHLDQILGEAEHAGLRTTLEKASSDDLLALADAARYRRRMDLARDTLLAERRRFPESLRALDAAFLLGRVEEA
ncbi:MAG TPA: FecR domain-containing protein, partial [Vicinamibacterales bacterium]|nr:FecR domain-containing protein [Vicinamibacterales bacterium]